MWHVFYYVRRSVLFKYILLILKLRSLFVFVSDGKVFQNASTCSPHNSNFNIPAKTLN